MTYQKSRMTKKGQVTIPVEIRRELDPEPGDYVAFSVVNGRAGFENQRSRVDEFFGMVEPRNRPEDFHAVRAEVERRVAEEVVHSMEREWAAHGTGSPVLNE
jgi:AbrB family looped-hinge helix DNA binding protein